MVNGMLQEQRSKAPARPPAFHVAARPPAFRFAMLTVAVLITAVLIAPGITAAAAATSAPAVFAAPTTKTAVAAPVTSRAIVAAPTTLVLAVAPTTKIGVVSITSAPPAAAQPTTKTSPAAPPTSKTAAAARPSSGTGEIPLQFYQIAVEAIVVEVSEKYSRQLGIQYTYSRNPTEGAVVKGVDVNAHDPAIPGVIVPQLKIIPGGVNFGNVTRTAGAGFSLTGMDVGDGQMGVRLRALIEEGKAQIRSRPMAITLNKQMVKIETVDKVPYQDVTFAAGIGQMAIQFEPVGVKLHAIPDIKSLPEGLIDLDLVKLEVSSVGRFINIGHVQRPVFQKSEANTRVIVHNHDTLVIGGFKIEQDTRNGQGVPFIRRVPVIKYLFSNENKNLDRRDILFYITPHILPPGIQPTLPAKFENRAPLTGIMLIPPAPAP